MAAYGRMKCLISNMLQYGGTTGTFKTCGSGRKKHRCRSNRLSDLTHSASVLAILLELEIKFFGGGKMFRRSSSYHNLQITHILCFEYNSLLNISSCLLCLNDSYKSLFWKKKTSQNNLLSQVEIKWRVQDLNSGPLTFT